MNEVYVVNAGAYSDNSIVGIFTSKQLAEKFVEDNKAGYYDPDCVFIDTYILDEFAERATDGVKLWTIEMGKDGTVNEVAQNLMIWDWQKIDSPWVMNNSFSIHVLARDEAQAIKKANNARAQLIAENLL